MELGAQFAEIHGWDDAEATFSQAIDLYPELVSGWEKRTDLYFRLGLFDLASSDYQRVYNQQEPAFAQTMVSSRGPATS